MAWIDGEVVDVNGGNIKVLCTSGKTVSSFSYLYLFLLEKLAQLMFS